MMIRTASTGVFLGCSGYSLPPKERCKSTMNLVPGNEIAEDDEGESESLLLRNKRRCQICGTAMDAYLLDEQRKLHICGNNPDCSGFEVETGQFRIKGYEGPSLECDKCGHEMQLKTGRFGKFFGCTNSECKNTRKLLASGEPAPPKMDVVPMPELLLIELLPHKDEIDSKYSYLFSAPTHDPDGVPAVVRFSRKAKEQYVQTEVDGKPTGWRATYDGKQWQVEDKRKK